MTLTRPHMTNDVDVPLTEAGFKRIAAIAKSRWGLDLDSAKMPLIKSRLRKRLEKLQIGDYEQYCVMIESGDPIESDHFISALTTNVTHFYRETHHFEQLETEILPGLIEKARNGHRIRFWSAGCSTGQEPYSLAGSILSKATDASKLDLKILATDVDPDVLDKATSGRYPLSESSFPKPEYEKRIFGNSSKSNPKEIWEVKDELKALISFRKLNLVQPWPISGRFDVIMCRNVAIYFDKQTQNRLWKRFSETLVPSGHLFIGHSERITNPVEFGLKATGITSYRQSDTISATRNQQIKDL